MQTQAQQYVAANTATVNAAVAALLADPYLEDYYNNDAAYFDVVDGIIPSADDPSVSDDEYNALWDAIHVAMHVATGRPIPD